MTSCLYFIFICVVLNHHSLAAPRQQLCEKNAYPPSDKDLVPTYVVDLDLPPLQRWAPVVEDKGKMLGDLVGDVKQFMEEIVGEKIFKILMEGLDTLATSLPYPYYEEIVGIAGYSNLRAGVIILYNIFYELFSECTSVVAQDPDGNIVHGRNLDIGFVLGWDTKNKTWRAVELLHPLTVHLQFKRKGLILFESTSFVGYVGILTAMRKDKFSLSLDKRFGWNGGVMGLLEWILFKDYKQSWVSFLTREVMQEAKDFEDAKKMLSKTRLLAPVYYILAGTKPGEGCIITRDRDNFDIWSLGSKTTGPGSWFLVQTNYDHWKQPPFYDDRRTPSNKCIQEGGQKNASLALIYNVLSTKPVLNKQTIYTSLMSARNGDSRSWLRYCPDPCWPW